jgi:hypothetical protein
MSLNCSHKRAYCSSPGRYKSMENHGGIISTRENNYFVHQSSLTIRPAELPSSKVGWTGEGNDELSLSCISVHTSNWHLTCRKILRHGADGFTSPQKEDVLRILSPLKIHCPRPGLNPRTLDPMARILTITPPRTTNIIRCMSGYLKWFLPFRFSVENTSSISFPHAS